MTAHGPPWQGVLSQVSGRAWRRAASEHSPFAKAPCGSNASFSGGPLSEQAVGPYWPAGLQLDP